MAESQSARIPRQDPAVRLDEVSNGPEKPCFAETSRPVCQVALECDLIAENFRAKATQRFDALVEFEGERCEEQIRGVVGIERHTDLLDWQVHGLIAILVCAADLL